MRRNANIDISNPITLITIKNLSKKPGKYFLISTPKPIETINAIQLVISHSNPLLRVAPEEPKASNNMVKTAINPSNLWNMCFASFLFNLPFNLFFFILKMGAEGIEPPTDGLEPTILPFNYAP